MTIRSGGRPRDQRPPHARRFESDAYATEYVPVDFEPNRRYGGGGGKGRRRGAGGSGFLGLLKFLIFTALLAGVVLIVALTALRPLVNNAILDMAKDNPAALNFPFIADIVREDLGTALTQPVSSDPAQVEFDVGEGDTAALIADRLETEGLIRDSRAFVFIASQRQLAGDLQQGTFVLRKNLTPDQLVSALLAPPPNPYIEVDLRTGLRLEQITAKLQTLEGLELDPREFYELAKEPPAALLADYPWLERVLEDAPEGASLEGFLWPATYRVLPDTTPEELLRKMLDGFHAAVGDAKMKVPAERGLSFYQVLSLASIVEREARLDAEKPLIAGVYQNRLDGHPRHPQQDPQRRSDGPLRERHGRARQDRLRSLAGVPVLGRARDAAPRDPVARLADGLPDVHAAGAHPRADRDPDARLDRRGPAPRHGRQVHLLPGHPRR